MRFNLRKAVGVVALPVLGSALAVGAAALPASAQTGQGTVLQAFNVQTTPSAVVGAVVNGVASGTGQGSTLSFTAPNGEAFTSPAFTAGTTDATLTTDTGNSLVLTSSSTGTGSGTLTFTISSATSGVTITTVETVQVSESSGTLGQSATPTSVPGESMTVTLYNNSVTGDVEFAATISGESGTVTFSQSNLPAGMVSGNPLVPGSAADGTYDGITYTATDPLGSTFSGTFDLQVSSPVVVPPPTYSPPPSTGNYGKLSFPAGISPVESTWVACYDWCLT